MTTGWDGAIATDGGLRSHADWSMPRPKRPGLCLGKQEPSASRGAIPPQQ